MRVVAIVLAAGVFLLGVGATWVGPDSSWDSRCPAAATRERTSLEIQASLWPPGSRCDVVLLPSGHHVVRSYVPWREWLAALAAAGLVWTVLAKADPRRRRPHRADAPSV
jgi:hypothetical protein